MEHVQKFLKSLEKAPFTTNLDLKFVKSGFVHGETIATPVVYNDSYDCLCKSVDIGNVMQRHFGDS